MARRPQPHRTDKPVYHLLNMGRTKFGDCIVVQIAGKTILIDGGHPGDYKDNDERPSIPSQLTTVLGFEPPFHFDLLIVTHCHQDHIGCLPKLVSDGTITCDRALVADEKLGFGLDVNGGEDSRLTGASDAARALAAALTEEDHSSLRGAELDEFLADAASLQDNYNNMLSKLSRDGTRVIRYRQGTAAEQREVQALVAEMAETGLVVFGPTANQLAVCAEVLQRASGDAVELMGNVTDAAASLGDLYRHLMDNRSDALDAVRSKAGAAKNCQSIVVAFGPENERVLLPGDMQFALPELTGFEQDLEDLKAAAAQHGPYALVKLPHHSSNNGTNQQLLEAFGWPELLAHSGGYNDPTHPNPDTLALLKQLERSHSFAYGRTDRNGLLGIDPSGGTQSGFIEYTGRLNDFTPNKKADEIETTSGETAAPEPPSPRTAVAEPSGEVRPPYVEITFARVPYLDGRITIDGRVIEIERPQSNTRQSSAPLDRQGRAGGSPNTPPPPPPPPRLQPNTPRLAGGRALPKLLFVTDPDRLGQNIGPQIAQQALVMIQSAGHTLIKGASASLLNATRAAIKPEHKGVVILGGYDVVPSQRVDVLDPQLRNSLTPELVENDPDGFVVWSDDAYGDREPDGVPELPVSRVPDARFAPLFMTQLTNGGAAGTGRFGLRNSARPFAVEVYQGVPGNETLLASVPTTPPSLQPAAIARPNVYFMLHGDYRNSTVFWGEDANGAVPAIDVHSIPKSGIGLAFAGCCWGGLTVSEPAFLGEAGPTPRMMERSMALLILQAGARAFVGSTGVHYSPGANGGFFGGPLHVGFWAQISAGLAPAEALFNARNDYLKAIPHGRTALFDLAVERKIYKEFTCLGLGW